MQNPQAALMTKGITHDQINALNGQRVTVTYEVWGPTADGTAREITGTQTITGRLVYSIPVELADIGSYVLSVTTNPGVPSAQILPYDVTAIAAARQQPKRFGCHDCGDTWATKNQVPERCQPYTVRIKKNPKVFGGYEMMSEEVEF